MLYGPIRTRALMYSREIKKKKPDNMLNYTLKENRRNAYNHINFFKQGKTKYVNVGFNIFKPVFLLFKQTGI